MNLAALDLPVVQTTSFANGETAEIAIFACRCQRNTPNALRMKGFGCI
jgi:hypothetical protein